MARTKRTSKTKSRAPATLATRARRAVESAGALALARVAAVRDEALARAGVARNRAARAATSLEHAFELRVAQAVRKLGVASHGDVRALSRQVAELQARVEGLRRSRARA